MSFLKKHWRFTVPVVVVLSVLLLGVVVLYNTGEPPEPKTVYAMPDSSSDNPPAINTGGLPLPASTTSSDPLVSEPSRSDTAHEEFQAELVDAEAIEPCCPDDSDISDIASTISIEPDGVFRAGLTFDAWLTAMAEHHEKEKDNHAAFDNQVNELLEFFQQIVAQVPVDKRREVFANVKSQIPPESLKYLQDFWESVPTTSDLTPGQTQDKLENFRALFAALDTEGQALNQEAQKLLSPK